MTCKEEGQIMPAKRSILETLPPLHPGEVLREEYLVPLNMSAGALARRCGVPRTRIERIATEKLGITGDTAVRLGRVLKTTPELWINLQGRFEIETARRELGKTVDKLEPLEDVACVAA
jgi:addiction module HigA family antidote